MRWNSDDGFPTDEVSGNGSRLGTHWCNISIEDDVLPSVTDHLLKTRNVRPYSDDELPVDESELAVYDDIPAPKDHLFVNMIRACRGDWDKHAEAYFATIPNLSIGNAALKTIAKGLLEQARPRGLSATKAEKIRSDYDLPALTATTVGG